jgi:hypothetical protein
MSFYDCLMLIFYLKFWKNRNTVDAYYKELSFIHKEITMKKLLIVIPLIVLVGCTVMAKKYQPQPRVIKELSTIPGVAKAGTLFLYAENYTSQTNADFAKAGLRVVLFTLQNTSSGKLQTTHQLLSNDIHGIGTSEYLQYSYQDAMALMNNSTLFKETVKGAAMGTLGGAAVGAAVGGTIGAVSGDAVAGAAVGAVIGGAGGGFEGASHYKGKAMKAMASELGSRMLPNIITIPSNSRINGTMFFPQDTHTLKTNIEGTPYEIVIHGITPLPLAN